jgi:SAM-dependent methyltransferase
MPVTGTPPLSAVFQWDVRTWSRALPLWEKHLPHHRPARALAIGEREGGLSLWLAWQGLDVACTDLRPFPQETSALHQRHGVQARITYQQADVTALPFPEATFDVVAFKSVIGALGSRERQAQALAEMHRVLKPGGVLLFAENLSATAVHAWLRRRFTAWAPYWRYLHPRRDRDLFSAFADIEDGTTGLLSALGRSEAQRDPLARVDALVAPMVPRGWRSVWYGAARKAPSVR